MSAKILPLFPELDASSCDRRRLLHRRFKSSAMQDSLYWAEQAAVARDGERLEQCKHNLMKCLLAALPEKRTS